MTRAANPLTKWISECSFWKPRNAVPSDRQVTFLVPKIGTQNETLDSDIEEGCTGIISYYHWLSRFETGMDLVAPAAHVWAPHRQRRQGWARRRWPRGPVWPYCHWRLALCIRFDCLEAEKSGTLKVVTIIQIRNFSTQHTVRPFIQTDDDQDHQEIPGSCCLPGSSLGNGVFAKSILIVNYSLCLPLIRVNGIGTLIWLGLITNTCE